MDRPRSGTISVKHDYERQVVPIVADGGIATGGIGDGRMIPLVILDTSTRPDLEEYIRLHQFIPTGDVKVRWAQLEGRPDTIALVLTFVRPAEVCAILEFDLDRHQGILVEQIMETRGLYVQAGRPGDRLKHDVNRPKVIVEVPDTGYRPQWNNVFERFAVKKMREAGLPRPNAKRAAKTFIEEIRRAAAFRMRPS